MAQNNLNLMGGTSGTMTYSSGPADVSTDADEVRLLLQVAADQGGTFMSYPSELSRAMRPAERAGWLASTSPPSNPITDKDGKIIGTSTSGFTSFSLTDAGRKELAARNAKLGSAATRMAHETRFIPGAGVVAYGSPRRVPLQRPFHLQDGGVVSR